MRRLAVALMGTFAGLVVSGSAASAGGWAVSSVDELPSTRAGSEVEIGFTIRQHGVTPVNVDGEVGVEITSPSGESRFFAADPRGTPGHYVARVVFPREGNFRWALRQGWFGEQDLGTIDVAGSVSGSDPTPRGRYRWPAATRFALPVLAVLLASVVVADAAVSSRQRRMRAAAG
jgi:hypothetical protein